MLINSLFRASMVVLTLALSQSGALNAYATQSAGAGATESHTHLSVVVDGAKNPELISDELAYRHFLIAVAQHRNPSAEEVKRQESILRPIRFSKDDHDVFLEALSGLKEQLDALGVARANPSNTSSGQTLEALRKRESNLLDDTAAKLRVRLSIEGVISLDIFIRDHVKRAIKIYGD